MSDFAGKVVLVSGGGTGIGRAAALGFRERGAQVVVTGRREAPLAALAAQDPDALAFVTGDVSRTGDPQRLVDFTLERFGRLDVLVNNAALHFSAPLGETEDSAIDELFGVNVRGLLSLTREALPHLEAAKGSVVNISSVVSRGVFPNYAVYASSKATVDHITRTLANELGPRGVRVNAAAPGLTATDMSAAIRENPEFAAAMIADTPLGRIGDPQDIAPAILFLASAQASWITGQVLQASGGPALTA